MLCSNSPSSSFPTWVMSEKVSRKLQLSLWLVNNKALLPLLLGNARGGWIKTLDFHHYPAVMRPLPGGHEGEQWWGTPALVSQGGISRDLVVKWNAHACLAVQKPILPLAINKSQVAILEFYIHLTLPLTRWYPPTPLLPHWSSAKRSQVKQKV